MNIKILVIDDDPIFHIIISSMAQHFAIENLSFARNGKIAMADIATSNEQELPDIIILDLNMPYVNGWDFLQWYETIIDTLPKKPSLYIASSSHDIVDIQKSEQIKCVVDHFIKPLTSNDFEKMIHHKKISS